MQKAILIHNPTAGEENHHRDQLIKLITSAGYGVKYFSTENPDWSDFVSENPDIIFVGGGDGTVQKLAGVLRRSEKSIQNVPVQILPLGTANNIAGTLHIGTKLEELLRCDHSTGLDIGEIQGAGEAEFFIEAVGFGIFPRLVKTMEAKEEDKVTNDPKEELQKSVEELLKIVKVYKAREASIKTEQWEIQDNFLLVEIMNIKYIGPNFELATNAEVDDGFFELVAIPESSRESLESYIDQLIKGLEPTKAVEDFALMKKVKDVRITWSGKDVHIDDESQENYSGEEFHIKNRKQLLTFVCPESKGNSPF